MKIRTLNQDSSSSSCYEEVCTKEAQEENILKKYNNALKYQFDDKLDESSNIVLSILKTDMPLMESKGPLSKTLINLKYSCYLNAGNLSNIRNEKKQALQFYDKASEIDNTDVTLWYKMGNVAIDLQFYRKAIDYFLEGLKHNEKHWLCLDKLIMLLFATNDLMSCLLNINNGLKLNHNYARGLVLRKMITEMNSSSEIICKQICSDYVHVDYNECKNSPLEQKLREECNDFRQKVIDFELVADDSNRKDDHFSNIKKLGRITWSDLGESLIGIHNDISKARIHHFVKIEYKKLFLDFETDNFQMDVDEKLSDTEIEDLTVQDDIIIDEENDDETDSQVNSKKKKSIFKKRRSDVSFLQPWFWHTTRKKSSSKRFDRFSTIEEALESLIYSNLLSNSNDLDEVLSDDDKSTFHSGFKKTTKSDQYFQYSHKQQIEDIKRFYSDLKDKYPEGIDIIMLMEEFLTKMIKFSNTKWPQKLLQVYSECFALYKDHFAMGDFLENVDGDYYEMLLIYLEISFNKDMNLWTLSRLRYILSTKGKLNLLLRMYWLMANYYSLGTDTDNATMYLQLTLQLLEESPEMNSDDYVVEICNANEKYSSIINSKVISKMLKNLDVLKQMTDLEKLYNGQQFPEIIEIVKNSFNCNYWKSLNEVKNNGNKIDRPVQLVMFLDSLWLVNDREECCKWTEVCLNEITNNLLLNFNKMSFLERQRNQKILEKCVLTLLKVIEETHLEKSKLIRLASNLSNLLRKEYNQTYYQQNQSNLLTSTNFHDTGFLRFTSSTDIWILLYYILEYYENNFLQSDSNNQEIDENDDDKLIPNSLIILFVAHDFLGRRSRCLENDGQLLSFALNKVEKYLEDTTNAKIRNKIEPFIEQTLFCMYEYPSKKNKTSRHLADHNVDPLKLTWPRCEQIIHFLSPRVLPEFDSYRIDSITNENEILFKKILDVVPSEFKAAQENVLVAICNFIENNHEKKFEMPKPVANFPQSVRNLYYLMGDYYLKNNDVNRAVKYLILDLTINPLRFDTWVELALAKNSQIEIKLNNLIDEQLWKNELEFFQEAYAAKTCFKHALKLVHNHSTLLIEFGSFAYMAHSFCSRFLKRDAQDLNLDQFSALESNKNYYLETVRNCFTRLNNSGNESTDSVNDENDERWLYHYMFGKVSDKQRENLLNVLEHYSTAAQLLNKKKAMYPLKINYNDPQHLSIEALEILYRMSASVLKMIQTKFDIVPKESESKVFSYLHNELSYFKKEISTIVINGEISTKHIIDLAIECLEECCFRFGHNYKSIYRLAHFYYHFNPSNSTLIGCDYKSYDKCYQLLFTQYKSNGGNTITGLFSDRKKMLFFNGIYRIPTSEVDRPGNFAYHMERCIQLSIQLLRKKHNYDALIDISIYLNGKPEPDKVYLTEKDRLQLCNTAVTMAAQCLKTKMTIINGKVKKSQMITFLLDVHRIYEKIATRLVQKEPCFLDLFLNAFKMYKNLNSDTNVPTNNKDLLESGRKCCQQLNHVKKAQLLQKQLQKTNQQQNDKSQSRILASTSTAGGPSKTQNVSKLTAPNKKIKISESAENSNNFNQLDKHLNDKSVIILD